MDLGNGTWRVREGKGPFDCGVDWCGYGIGLDLYDRRDYCAFSASRY